MSPKTPALNDGFLIVFEGIDGSGKTTQLEAAKTALEAEGWPVYATRNLGGTPIGEELRKVIKSPLERPAATSLYISVAIQEALAEVIEAERRKGALILMDRGPLSLAAYEVYGSGLDGALGWKHVEDGLKRLRPELTIIYDTDTGVALKRARGKSKKADYYESKPSDYFERVAQGYHEGANRYPEGIVMINSNGPAEEVQAQTMAAIRRALKRA